MAGFTRPTAAPAIAGAATLRGAVSWRDARCEQFPALPLPFDQATPERCYIQRGGLTSHLEDLLRSGVLIDTIPEALEPVISGSR